MSFEKLCERGKQLRPRKPRRQCDARPADFAGLARRCLHPRLHLGHDRSAQGRDADAPQPDLCGLYLCRNAVGIADKPFEAVSYLPLCHVAERCYGEVMQLVLGGTVSFAESIDTVALNIREIAPTFFVGVPRIYEKLQQGFPVQARREADRLRQRFVESLLCLGPQSVGPPAGRRRRPGSTASLRAAVCPDVPQHPAPPRVRPQPSPALRRRLDFAGDAALLRHRRPPGLAGLRFDRKRRRRLHPDQQPSPLGGCGLPMPTPNGSSDTTARSC
jgi:hypothetical protein